MRNLFLLLILIMLLLFVQVNVQSDIPRTVNYQAKLFDNNGNPYPDGTVICKFAIFEQQIGGTAIWTEQQDVDVKDGFINVYLGSVTPLDINFDKQLWLEVTIENEAPFPRTPLSSIPTAFNSMMAETVPDGAITERKLADAAVTEDKLADGSVSSGKILNGSIIDEDISDNARINVSKLNAGAEGQVLMTSGGEAIWGTLAAGKYWGLKGNSGTSEGENFIGTNDNTPLEIRVANEDEIKNSLIFNRNGSIYKKSEIDSANNYTNGDERGNYAVELQSGRRTTENVASGEYSVIAGGWNNKASASAATVGGGMSNSAGADLATVSGGSGNTASGIESFVGGGKSNFSVGSQTVVTGGQQNKADGQFSFIGGGGKNLIRGSASVIAGGLQNRIDTNSSVIAGGTLNWIKNRNSFIGGGYLNRNEGDLSFIGGGNRNLITVRMAVLTGGDRNYVSGEGATVSGGGSDSALGAYSTVSGGKFNKTSELAASVGGGYNNTASGEFATIAGGYRANADKYGQHAYASGSFSENPPYGDAQTSVFVVRNKTYLGVSSVDLYLNGSNARMTLNDQDAWAFRALVVGKDNTNLRRAAYIVTGLIVRNGSTTTLYGLSTTVIYESKAGYDAMAYSNLNSLCIRVTGDTKVEMRWVARVEVSQLNY